MILDQIDPNPDWESPLPGWEPWEPDYEPDPDPIGCHYCDSLDTRVDPFAGKPCCDGCFNELIGGDREDDPPFRCGNCVAVAGVPVPPAGSAVIVEVTT